MTAFWEAWNWNPLLGGVLAFTAWRYMDGVWKLWQRAGTGRGISRWRVSAFWGGLAALFVALISPIDTYSETLLSMHMIQHVLLMVIAPPLMVLGMPPIAMISMLPLRWRQGTARWWLRQHNLNELWRGLSTPAVTTALYAIMLWVWHVPLFYQAAVNDPFIHIFEHTSFFGAAFLFWWRIVHSNNVSGVLLLFVTAVHSSILAVLMIFSNQVWYAVYSSLEDQQIAGLIMWIPGGVIYTTAGLLLLWRWLHEMEKNDAKIMA